MVPGAGVEPAQPRGHWCLRPTRLPIPPSGLMRAGEHWTAKIRKIIHTPSGKWENRRVKGRGSRRFAYLCGQWRELFISRTLNWSYLGFCVVFGRGQPVKRKLPVSGRREACLPVSDRQASMLWWTAMWPEGSPRYSKPRA